MGTMEDPKAGEILEKSTEAQASASTSSISASTSSSWQRSSMSNAKFDIEKFDGTNNFGMWQCEVLDLLFREGSDIALNSKPKDISDEDWNYVNRQACGTIRLCLAKDQKYFVMKETMASSLWKKLEDKYMTKSIENRLYLKKKLFRFQYKKGISMIEHLDNYNKILADLQNLDVEIIDEDKALLLLNSLPDTYEHLTTTLLYGKDEVKFIDVSNALVNNEYRKKDQLDHRDSTSEALTVARGRTNNRRSGVPSERGRSRSKSRGPSHSKPKGESSFRRPAKDECAYCHQKGHWKKDCPNKDKSNVNVAITGRAAVSSNSDDEASDTSRLWHMRLGHVGEKTLQGLVKQGRLKGAKTEALMYASHIVNRLPASALDGKTPKEVWSGQPVSDYDQLHIFGCPAYFHVTESKLDPRAKKAIFVGFSEGVKGFRLWNPESKKIILSRDVTFDESAMLKQIPRDTENENPNSLQQVEFETPKKSEKASSTVDHPDDEFDDQDEISVEVEDSAPVPEIRQQPESIATSRQKRDIRRPARYTDMVAYALPVEIDRLKAQLSSEFDMKDLGEAKKILGMEIKRDRVKGTICLTQTQYLKTVLQSLHSHQFCQSKPSKRNREMEKQGLGCRRVVLVPCPLQGHINPMLRLGTILHSKGFSITVAHTQFNSPNTCNHPDFVFLPLLSDDSSSERNDSDDFVVFLSNLNLNHKASLQKLLTQIVEQEQEQHEGLPCIIYDALMYSVEEVAHSLKLPSIILHSSCATSLLSFFAYAQLREEGRIPSQGSKSMELVPGLHPFRFKDLAVFDFKNEDTLLPLIAILRNKGTSSSAMIWNSMDCLEKSSLAEFQQQCQVPNFSIGPMQKIAPASSSSLWEEDHSCITWLDKQTENSVIYVSFGSIAMIDEKDVAEIAWGLANSKQPFLWVLSSGSVNGSDSIDLLPDDFKETVGERGCIVKWAPQEQVLAHHAVGGFFTHCGWNSTIESISEGVPMICRPIFGDQRINSRYISHVWRVGIELENGLEREEIEKAIKMLVVEKEGEEMKQRAANLKLKTQLCIQKNGSSYDSLNELVEFIMSL
ncbi:hypothetical protein EZV62_002818 [Acer yangbiense]|uniref:CCHC-type domain-containing protein n=2 Tax=Acer yangbiense TaxID=1000413 RepID=A0A5C7IYM2_9ROSI|nr:hypothetical protein EZV62_002818 [Acer yangbiense]